jgi:hypothetical protein
MTAAAAESQTGSRSVRDGAAPIHLGAAGRVKRLALVSAMSLVTLNVWTGSPLLALWIGSRVEAGGPPSMAAVAVVAVTLAVFSVVLVKVLSTLGGVHDRLIGRRPGPREPAPWLRSLRGERAGEHDRELGLTTLERVLVAWVVIAVVAFEIWFFFFSGSPLGTTSGR